MQTVFSLEGKRNILQEEKYMYKCLYFFAMLHKKQEIPSLRSIPGWLEVLAESFIPRARDVILHSNTLVDAVLWIEQESEHLYAEYSSLYRTSIVETTVPLVSSSEHAGFDSLASTHPSFLSIAPRLRAIAADTTIRALDAIDGVEKDRFLPLLKKWIEVRLQVFRLMNYDAIKKPLTWFADPDILFQREKDLYARNFSARLEESLDPSNPFIDSYADVLNEIEKATWHEMIFYATIVSDEDLIGDSFLPFNYEKNHTEEIPYLPGEQKLTSAISSYRTRYFEQFLIHRKLTGKMKKIAPSV